MERRIYLFTEINKYYETKINNNNRLIDILNIEKVDPYNKEGHMKSFLKLEEVIEYNIIFNKEKREIERIISENYEDLFLKKENIFLGLDTLSKDSVKADLYRKRNNKASNILVELNDFKIEGTIYNLYQKFNSEREKFIGIVNSKIYLKELESILKRHNNISRNFCVINREKIKTFKIIREKKNKKF